MKRFYRCWYGITASIDTRKNGTAKLVIKQMGKTVTNKVYSSASVAKRVLSRACDGTANEYDPQTGYYL